MTKNHERCGNKFRHMIPIYILTNCNYRPPQTHTDVYSVYTYNWGVMLLSITCSSQQPVFLLYHIFEGFESRTLKHFVLKSNITQCLLS